MKVVAMVAEVATTVAQVVTVVAEVATTVAKVATLVAEVATMVAKVAKPHILLMKYIFYLNVISLKLKELVILDQSLKNLNKL